MHITVLVIRLVSLCSIFTFPYSTLWRWCWDSASHNFSSSNQFPGGFWEYNALDGEPPRQERGEGTCYFYPASNWFQFLGSFHTHSTSLITIPHKYQHQWVASPSQKAQFCRRQLLGTPSLSFKILSPSGQHSISEVWGPASSQHLDSRRPNLCPMLPKLCPGVTIPHKPQGSLFAFHVKFFAKITSVGLFPDWILNCNNYIPQKPILCKQILPFHSWYSSFHESNPLICCNPFLYSSFPCSYRCNSKHTLRSYLKDAC